MGKKEFSLLLLSMILIIWGVFIAVLYHIEKFLLLLFCWEVFETITKWWILSNDFYTFLKIIVFSCPWLSALYTEKCSVICSFLFLRLSIIKVLYICLQRQTAGSLPCDVSFDGRVFMNIKAYFWCVLQSRWMLWSDIAVPSSSEGYGGWNRAQKITRVGDSPN